MRAVRAVALVMGLMLVWGVLLGAQTAEITTWTIPTPGSLPEGVAIAEDGTVYFTEYTGQKIGRLDPTANWFQERTVMGNPSDLVVLGNSSVYYSLPDASGMGLLMFDGGGNYWELPTGVVHSLAVANDGPGAVNIWFTEWTAKKVGRFSPAQIIVNTLFVKIPRVPVISHVTQVQPVITSVSQQRFPGNPALPPPIAAVPPATNGPFTEWVPMGNEHYVTDITVDPAGNAWFTQWTDQLMRLDSDRDTMSFFSLPDGTAALGIAANPAGKIWFTDTSGPGIGRLDPENGNVTIWPIPNGVQPLEIRYHNGLIWFADREADAIGVLDRDANTIAIYNLAPNSHPVDLEVTDDGTVWFVCERGNTIGRLRMAAVVTPPPNTTGQACAVISSAAIKLGKKARVTITYRYDGTAGFPVYLRAIPAVSGTDQSEFYYSPVEITETGIHSVTQIVMYTGPVPLDTDELHIVLYNSAWEAICGKRVKFETHWKP